MICLGIDPGKNGAYALIDTEQSRRVWTKVMDEPAFIHDMQEIARENGSIGCLEKVGAMPGQGVTSMFTFGRGFGFLEGVLQTLLIAYQLTPPQKWKKEYSLNSDKSKSIEVCQNLFPDVSLLATPKCRKPHDGMAEALLMAEYARRVLYHR
jgi:crossover junction endodeoxyribonuclease RuvC